MKQIKIKWRIGHTMSRDIMINENSARGSFVYVILQYKFCFR